MTTSEQHLADAIMGAQLVCLLPAFVRWAEGWLSGVDRSAATAARTAEAATTGTYQDEIAARVAWGAARAAWGHLTGDESARLAADTARHVAWAQSYLSYLRGETP